MSFFILYEHNYDALRANASSSYFWNINTQFALECFAPNVIEHARVLSITRQHQQGSSDGAG
jgi:hypothetical protein